MADWIASAEQVDMSEGNWRIVLIWAGILIGACILACVPIVIAKARRHRFVESVLVLAIVWGLLTAESAGHAVNDQINWQKEYVVRVKTGYYDPRDTSDAPRLPWRNWGLLGLGYVAVLIWSGAGPSKTAQP